MFNIDNINKLICYLIAIQQYAKDIHYTVHGDAFYAKHLFADRIANGQADDDVMTEYIDQMKEVCVLGHEYHTLTSLQYLQGAIELLPEVAELDDKQNFLNMHSLLKECLTFIDELQGLTRADENLIGAIAQDLQNNFGLLNLQIEE
jgi:DNA-binding ferritin-like protein|nr:MAG TPA: hypothetical protein [Caudoviricetes sp.]